MDVGRAQRRPGETEEADRLESYEPDEGFEAALGTDTVFTACGFHLGRVIAVEGEEEEVGDYVADEQAVRG